MALSRGRKSRISEDRKIESERKTERKGNENEEEAARTLLEGAEHTNVQQS